jgi:Tfp pilus assembly major pilin PilA
MHCHHCGTPHTEEAQFCTQCGQSLSAAPLTPAQESRENFQAILGPKNQAYYLDRFEAFEANGKTTFGWHWPAFFVTFYWLLYRKMWLTALLYFILPYAVTTALGVIGALVGGQGQMLVLGGYGVYCLAILLLPPMLANGLYYRHCQSKIRKAEAQYSERQRLLGYLSGKGGTSNVLLFVVLIFGLIAVIGILAAIALPAYQEYTQRAKMMQVYQTGQAVTQELTLYYADHQALPDNLNQLTLPALPPRISALQLDSEQGVLALQLAAPASGQSMEFVASTDASGELIWHCQSQTIPPRSLPAACR